MEPHPSREAIRHILHNFVDYRDRIEDTAVAHTWEIRGSMNHDWLHKSTFLLTAQNFKEVATDAGNQYKDGHDKAEEHYAAWRVHLRDKINQHALLGIDPEIAAPLYSQVTLQALFNLRDLSEDQDLKAHAERFLSLYFADAAMDSFHGVRGGAKTRTYKDSNATDADADVFSWFSHLFANDPIIPPYSAAGDSPIPEAVGPAIVGPAMSDYALPEVVQKLLTDPASRTATSYSFVSTRPGRGSLRQESCTSPPPTSPNDKECGVYRLAFPSSLRRETYVTSGYALGVFADDDSFGEDVGADAGESDGAPQTYTQIHSQNEWMGLVGAGWRYSRIYFQRGAPCAANQASAESSSRDLRAVLSKGAILLARNPRAWRPSLPDDASLFAYLSSDFAQNLVYPQPDSGQQGWFFTRDLGQQVYVALRAVDSVSCAEAPFEAGTHDAGPLLGVGFTPPLCCGVLIV